MKNTIYVIALVVALSGSVKADPDQLSNHGKEGSTAQVPLAFKDQNGDAVRVNSITTCIQEKTTTNYVLACSNQPTPASTPLATQGAFPANYNLPIPLCGSKALLSGRDSEDHILSVYFTYGGVGATPGPATGTGSAQYRQDNFSSFKVAEQTPAGVPNGTCVVQTVSIPTVTPTNTP